MTSERQYIAIDLKSFYASVEAADRDLDPLDVNLVVADESRTDKTICLAVSPSLKALGMPGRPRLFEARQRVREINAQRLARAPGRQFRGKSVFASELAADPSLELDMIVAQPRMRRYMTCSRDVVKIYLRYVSPEDLLVYSVDEVFIDATAYLGVRRMTAHAFAMSMIRDVLRETHITATAGIGTNMYLAKVAMDIVAKRMAPDRDGVRIARLDEQSYRRTLWDHRPLTDFWHVGRGIARKLERYGLYTMGDVALCSEGEPGSYHDENLLYRLFGVNAELLIDHAWGWEPTRIADCRQYRPQSRSQSRGQVLARPYTYEQGRIVLREMADQLSMDLAAMGFYTDQVVVDVSYDAESLRDPERAAAYRGPVAADYYGRLAPCGVHGSQTLESHTFSTRAMTAAMCGIYDRITDRQLLIRRLNVAACRLLTREETERLHREPVQYDLFTDYGALERELRRREEAQDKERRIQMALLSIRGRYGKNAVFKGLNLQEGATAIERNRQVGGHRA